MAQLNSVQRICVMGMGNMGSALAISLLDNNCQPVLWNRSVVNNEGLLESCATITASALEAVYACEIIVLCVTNNEASLSILEKKGMREALKGKLVVQLSTVSSKDSQNLERWAQSAGISYLDGSILGYPDDVTSGNCTIIYSGPREYFVSSEAALAGMGGNPRHISDVVGKAVLFDKAIYSSHYGSLLAFFHGAALCHAAGLSIDVYADLVTASTGSLKRMYAGRIEKRSYENPYSSLKIDAAAYSHVAELSAQLGVDTTLPDLVTGFFEQAIADGRGEQEIASVFELMIR